MKQGPDQRVDAARVDTFIRENDIFFLDVREAKELQDLGTLEGYYNIPFGELEKRLGELPKDRLILTA
jgi:rhodanese-related sulfurtransferase